jgi:hypothetical protein
MLAFLLLGSAFACTLSVDPNGKCVTDANGFSILDADSDIDIPISLTISTKGETIDAFTNVHPATSGALDFFADDGRYILGCPQGGRAPVEVGPTYRKGQQFCGRARENQPHDTVGSAPEHPWCMGSADWSGHIGVADAITEFNPPNYLNSPRGMAFGPSGALYIADGSNNRVTKWEGSSMAGCVGDTCTAGASVFAAVPPQVAPTPSLAVPP